MLEDYARRNGFPNPTHFTDDGISGTRFDRPAFTAMMEEVEAGRVDTIIVKDMSRLGRDYLKVGQIMGILRQKGIRLIAINDGVDSDKGDDDFLPFRNIMNDLYSRDCSVKVKNGKRTTALQGKYQNPWAPFGYVKSAQERGKLEVDSAAAEIVRRIFGLFLEGRGAVEVARILNRDGVPTKSDYRTRQGDTMRWQYAGAQNYWTAAVHSILTDRRYIGSVVYGQRMTKRVAAHRNIKAPPEKLVEGCYEPLISREYFDRAQALLGSGMHHAKSNRPLAGKIKCGVCGHAMPLRKAKDPYFSCGTKWYDSEYSCGDFRVGRDELFEVLKQALQQQIALRVEQEALRQFELEKLEKRRTVLEQQLSERERQLARGKENMRVQFEQFAAGRLTQEDFAAFHLNNKQQTVQQKNKIKVINQQMAELWEKEMHYKAISLTAKAKNAIMNRNGTEVSPELLDEVVCEVRVCPNEAVEIEWNFKRI